VLPVRPRVRQKKIEHMRLHQSSRWAQGQKCHPATHTQDSWGRDGDGTAEVLPAEHANDSESLHGRKYRHHVTGAPAPLDNNVCERALKKVILHRKNALFYKNQNGAQVGDVFMSLIHTCELSHANPFDYLTQLQRHAADLAESPRDWMPWNYCATLAQLDTAA